MKTIPTLDDIATGAARRLAEFESPTLIALMEQSAAVQAVLATALLQRQAHERRVAGKAATPDEWLTPEAAAKIAKLSPRFFYRHSICGCDRCAGRMLNGGALGFVKRVSHRNIRISKLGLEAWLSERGR